MKFSLSSIAIWIIVLACLTINFSIGKFEKPKDVIKDDVVIYYQYLPLIFIYNDIKFEKKYGEGSTKDCIFWPMYTPEWKSVIKMTTGLAILYSPFFFIAHSIALLFDYNADGYSQPYTTMLLISTIFYLAIGLYFLKKTLKHYLFSDTIIAITILLLGLGTNLLCYASQSAPMPHVYLFCLISIFFYYTIKWYQSPTIKNSLIVGFTTGLTTLTRPSDGIIIILFILYGISNFADIKTRIILFRKKFFFLLLIIVSAFLVFVPQFVYWKIATGHFFYYSYNDERFFFNQPRIIEGLFSFRKGWFVYTPMMLFAFAGMFLMTNELKKLRSAIWLFTFVNFYIIFSWWCWWYGGSFGLRSMIDSYAIMALPLASTIGYVNTNKKILKIGFYSSAIFFIWLNIFQTYQFENKVMHYDGLNRKLYFKIFGKTKWKPEYDEAATSIDAREAKLGRNGIYEPAFPSASFVSEDTVFIRSLSGGFLTLDSTEKKFGLFSTNVELPGENETFILKKLHNGQYAITGTNKLYVSANLAKNGEISASEREMRLWETFTLIDLPNEFFAIKAANGKFISANKNSLQLSAKSDVISDSETFEIIKP